MCRVIDFEKGRMKYRRNERNSLYYLYEKGTFEVISIGKDGFIELKLLRDEKTFKLLVDKRKLKEYSVGQKLKLMISKKLFFTYWEIEYYDNIFIE